MYSPLQGTVVHYNSIMAIHLPCVIFVMTWTAARSWAALAKAARTGRPYELLSQYLQITPLLHPSPPAKLDRTPIKVMSLRMQLYAYRENTLNGEKYVQLYIPDNNTNFKMFLILSIYIIWDGLSLKPISRYCLFKCRSNYRKWRGSKLALGTF